MSQSNHGNHGNQFTRWVDVAAFLFAGDATLTLVSRRTGQRFTYRVRPARQWLDSWTVGLLSGPNNDADADYQYLGIIEPVRGFHATKGTRVAVDAPSLVAFGYFYRQLVRAQREKVAGCDSAPELEVWHEGRCGRCGRKLTVPESISRGLGPECLAKAEAA